MYQLCRYLASSALLWVPVVLLLIVPTETRSHTKGLSLSRFGLLDVSLTGNFQIVGFEGNPNFAKIGDRLDEGFNLTSFDIAITGELPTFPLKLALFAAVEEDTAGIEEAFFYFHKLGVFAPALADFQATLGIFRVKFGQFNQIHDHEWFLGDPPLIHVKFLSADGVHLPGAEVTYQPPLPFFLLFSLGAQNGDYPAPSDDAPATFGGTAAGEIKGTVLFPRVETYVDLTEAANLAVGLSGAIGRNKSSEEARDLGGERDDHTYLLGFDLLYRWKPGTRPGWPYIRWLTEFIWAFREHPLAVTGRNAGSVVDSDVVGGFFTELGYRFTERWQVTGRIDYVGLPEGEEDEDFRISTAIRYYLTPVAKVQLQYNYNAESGDDNAFHTFMFQINVGIGTVTPGVGKFLDPF